MSMTSGAILWLLLSAVPAIKGDDPCGAIQALTRIHMAHWTKVNAANLAVAAGEASSSIVEEQSGDSGSCPPRYFTRSFADAWRIRFQIGTGVCPSSLHNVTFRADLTSEGEAERLRICIINALLPGGLPIIEGDTFHFIWRSDDSQTRYELWVSVSSATGGQRVEVRLTHDAARPEDVDYLPFRKGYMGTKE
jgi:hypothetical protein